MAIPEFGIQAGAYYLPKARRHLREWAHEVRAPARLVEQMEANGLGYFHVGRDEAVQDFAESAVDRLIAESGLRPGDVDVVIHTHTNQTSVMASPLSVPARVKRRFGMSSATCFAVAQQNCVSLMCAIRLVRTILWRHPAFENVLVFSADKVLGERTRNVSDYAIQSDGALALWLRRGARKNRVGYLSYYIDGRYFRGSAKGPELTTQFSLNYPFVAHRMLKETMDASGWAADDVDAVCPMNANLTAFKRVIELLEFPLEKLYARNIKAIGHVFCCDPFINFLQCFSSPAQGRKGNALLYASSSSGCFAAMAIHDA
jgi:3-oxoacyl-[acyl-carrier-protein] synthase III